jgi:predicted helicase
MGNPPYSVGQKSANDNAQNQVYPKLESRIAATYAAASKATNKNSLYDSYIKAFRWSTDRLDPQNGGVVCFVSNASWIEGNAQAGFRKYLEDEFTAIYVFNLRGNCRTSGELRRKEAGNVFGLGSRTPISITVLVKNCKIKSTKADIYYYAVEDYLDRNEKLKILSAYKSINNQNLLWCTLTPNKHDDWLSQRNDIFDSFIPIGDKDNNNSNTFFTPHYSNGLKTARDHFCWNFSEKSLVKIIKTIISFYNQQCEDYRIAKETNKKLKLDDFVTYDSTKITWNRGFKQDLERETKFKFSNENIYSGLYRPYCRSNAYFSKELNDMTYLLPKLFPNTESKNLIICVPGVGVTNEFSILIINVLPDLEIIGKSQCFPLYWYEHRDKVQGGLFEQVEEEYIKHDGISDFILKQARERYGNRVTKEDIFYYVYGILHSPTYRTTFSNDLKKMLPRLPLVEKPHDFWEFSEAGKKMAELHLNYEDQKKPTEVKVTGTDKKNFIVNKMEFAKKDKKEQKDTIIYNSHITISNIPAKAYEYVVNGKSAIEWIMERYAVIVHKESGITNNPNDWAAEHGDPRYILDLLLSVITVSVNTIDIVNSLPKIDWKAKQ